MADAVHGSRKRFGTKSASVAPFTERARRVMRAMPGGRLASYGQIAMLAGAPAGARQVVRILHSSSAAERLPWHRVLRADGRVALPPGAGFEEQCARLAAEGVEVSRDGRVDLERFGWKPRRAFG